MLSDKHQRVTEMQTPTTVDAQAAMITKHGVGVIIMRDDAKVLLGQRKGSHGADSWGFPCGHPEADETLL